MIKMKQNSLFIAGLLLTFLMSCQPQTADAPVYSENEIPVNTSSEEAMNEFMSGLKYSDLGDGQKARPYFEKALEADPDFVSAQMYRAFSSNSAKDFAENRDKWLAMRDKANDGEKIMMDIIQAGIEDDDLKEHEITKKLVEAYPKSARAHDWLAGSYSGMEEEAKARELLTKAMELDPDYIPAVTNLGLSYLFSSPKDFKQAENYFAKAVEMAPENSRVHYNLGDSYRAQNDFEKALSSYLKAAEIDPKDQVSMAKAGHANTFLGNFDDARKNYQEARKRSEFGTGGYVHEGYTYLHEGDHKKALSFLKNAIAEIDALDIPESNKNGAKMGCTFNSAMIASHFNEADQLKEIVESMKPLSAKLVQDIGTEAAKINQKANMQVWDAFVLAKEGDFDAAVAKAADVKTTLEPIKDPDKLRGYHRVHAFVNYKQGNYDKALEHLSHMNKDNVYDKYWTAKANEKAGNTEKAMEMFKELVDNNFNNIGYALIRNELRDMLNTSS